MISDAFICPCVSLFVCVFNNFKINEKIYLNFLMAYILDKKSCPFPPFSIYLAFQMTLLQN